MAWVLFLFLSLTSYAFPSGASESCYEVVKVGGEGCVRAIKILEEGEGWFAEACDPPYHLYRLHGGEVSVAATLPHKILDIVADSKGNPSFISYHNIDGKKDTMEGKPYTLKNGTLSLLTDDDKVFVITIDKKDTLFMTIPPNVIRYKDGVREKIENAPVDSALFFSDEHKNFFLGNEGGFWELKEDGTVRVICDKINVFKIIKHPTAPGYLAASDLGLFHVKDDALISIKSGEVYSMVSTKDGRVYFTTDDSVLVMKSGEISEVEGLQYFRNHSGTTLFKDGNDNIFVGSHLVEVLRHDGSPPQVVKGFPPKVYIQSIDIDSNNNVIIQANYDDSIKVYFLAENSLQANLVDGINGVLNTDHQGSSTYIGTRKGLYLLKSKKNCKAS